jgi:hypothetical protein
MLLLLLCPSQQALAAASSNVDREDSERSFVSGLGHCKITQLLLSAKSEALNAGKVPWCALDASTSTAR